MFDGLHEIDWSSMWHAYGSSDGHTYGRGNDENRMIPGWPYSIVAAPETGRTSWTALLDEVDRRAS